MKRERQQQGSGGGGSSSSSSSSSSGSKKGKVSSSTSSGEYESEVAELKKTMSQFWEDLFCQASVSEEERGEAWVRLQVLGFPLCQKYSWAIPDRRAIAICRQFAPLVEIGAGKGYWSHLMQTSSAAVDVVALDKYTAGAAGQGGRWTEVGKGGPETLTAKGKFKHLAGRNLLLSYPDEAESVAMECLENFQGEFVVHIGELIATGTKAGGMQNPWGRTSSSDFQVALLENFHCVLVHKLPSFPFANDYITVWQRSQWTVMPEDGDEDAEEDGEEDEGPDTWRDVPADERLPDLSRAAPKYQHLLSDC